MYGKEGNMYEKKNEGTLKKECSKENQGHKNDIPEKDKGQENEELKSLIAGYVEEALTKAKSAWDKDFESRIASEREDAAKMATMSSEERARVEMERRQKDFETERQQYVSERAEFEAAKELAAQNLPVNFSKMVADADKETMLENVAAFKAEYMKAIEAGLSQRLKGTLPKVSTEKEQISDPFLNGLGM